MYPEIWISGGHFPDMGRYVEFNGMTPGKFQQSIETPLFNGQLRYPNVQDSITFRYRNDINGRSARLRPAVMLSQFIKGLVSPITGMFQSTKTVLLSGLGIVGTGALLAATQGALAPILFVAGLGFGAVQGISALQKFASAKNGRDVEQAFFDLGAATTGFGLSLTGSKAALKPLGVQTEKMNMSQVILRNLQEAPAALGQSWDVIILRCQSCR